MNSLNKLLFSIKQLIVFFFFNFYSKIALQCDGVLTINVVQRILNPINKIVNHVLFLLINLDLCAVLTTPKPEICFGEKV
jgi:hypothetical protein